jgi:uncharacterized protein
MTFYTIEGDAILLAVRLTPRARKDALAGLVDAGDGKAALAIRLAAPPVEGAANAALISFLSRALGVPKSSLAIAAGEKSRLKRVRVRGVAPADVEKMVSD